MANDHEQAFMNMIHADPDDDTPRLIFADWLDENSKPERAEFIRVQIQIAQSRKRRADLLRHQTELLDIYGGEWRAEELGRNVSLNERSVLMFRRGFLEKAVLTYKEALTYSFRLESTLVRELQLVGDANLQILRKLARTKFFQQLHSLSLFGNYIGNEGASTVLEQSLSQLEELDVRYNRIAEVARETIANKYSSKIRTLLTWPQY